MVYQLLNFQGRNMSASCTRVDTGEGVTVVEDAHQQE